VETFGLLALQIKDLRLRTPPNHEISG